MEYKELALYKAQKLDKIIRKIYQSTKIIGLGKSLITHLPGLESTIWRQDAIREYYSIIIK
ncbi:MAG: hypothetical protein PT120_11825 [Aphanizomenon gracile PMC649.10]|nr:hypothetical protein [Aphanizomenon gracile PMC649.10]